MKSQNTGHPFDSPTKSRISTRISQSFIEIESEMNKRSLTALVPIGNDNEEYLFPIKNLFVKVNIIVCKEKENIPFEIKSINLQVNDKNRVYDLIKISIDNFNDGLTKENSLYRLDPDYRVYNLKPSKKSGKPDSDLPSFDNSVFVSNCFAQQYTLVAKANPENYETYLRIVKRKSQGGAFRDCKNCNIL